MTEAESPTTSVRQHTAGDMERELLERVREEGTRPVDVPKPRRRSRTSPRPSAAPKKTPADIEGVVMSLAAKGLSYAQIAAHCATVHDHHIRPETVRRITDRVMEELVEWQTRPLDLVYPVI